jgi:hypothetical protein
VIVVFSGFGVAPDYLVESGDFLLLFRPFLFRGGMGISEGHSAGREKDQQTKTKTGRTQNEQ